VIAFAAHAYFGPTMMPYYNGWWYFFPFGFIFFFIIVFFVSRLLFLPWGWGRRGGYWYGYGDPKDIIKRRYARGEITKDQFDQMMRDLDQHA
jgi:putative membrane protein